MAARASLVKPVQAPAGLPGEEGEQVVGQLQAIGAIPERRQGDLQHVEPIEQVLAERAVGDHRLQVAVGRRDQPHVGRPLGRLADPLVPPLLEEPQQLRLQRERQVADLVEEERAALGRGHLAARVADGAGEGALHVAEQLALQQLGAEARATDRHERPGGPAAPAVQCPREHALARAALAADQHGGLGRGDPAGQLQHPAHRRVARVQVRLGDLVADPVLECLDPVAQAALPGDALEHGADLGRGERLGQVVVGPAAHGLDGRVDRGVRRDDDHDQPRRLLAQRSDEIQARLAPEPQVDQGGVARPTADAGQRLGPRRRLADLMAGGLQREAERSTDIGLIVDNRNFHETHCPRS